MLSTGDMSLSTSLLSEISAGAVAGSNRDSIIAPGLWVRSGVLVYNAENYSKRACCVVEESGRKHMCIPLEQITSIEVGYVRTRDISQFRTAIGFSIVSAIFLGLAKGMDWAEAQIARISPGDSERRALSEDDSDTGDGLFGAPLYFAVLSVVCLLHFFFVVEKVETITFSSASAEIVWKNVNGAKVKTNSDFEGCAAYTVAKKVEQARVAVLAARVDRG